MATYYMKLMQLILQSKAGPFEVLRNIMKMVQGKFIHSDFCNLVTTNMNFTRHMKNMTNCSLIHMLNVTALTENTAGEISVLSRCRVIFRKHIQQEQ
jgi:hypothetical protein